MCEFVSFTKKGRKTYFLTRPLIDSPTGRELLKNISREDLPGHGAIRLFYGLERDEGTNSECTDFSTPDNFPGVIANAIKRGEMRGLGTPLKLLGTSVDADYYALRKLLGDDYYALRKPLDDDYSAKCKLLDDDYYALRKPLGDDYSAKCKLLDDDHSAKCKPLDDDYSAKCKPLDDDHSAKCKLLDAFFWDLFAIPENRNPTWR